MEMTKAESRKEKQKLAQKKYREKNMDNYKTYMREHQKEFRAKMTEEQKECRRAYMREYSKEYAEKNCEVIREYKRKYYLAKKELLCQLKNIEQEAKI